MQEKVNLGSQYPVKVQNQTIRGLNLSMFIAKEGTTTVVRSHVDLSKVRVKATLSQRGKVVVICDGNLQALYGESAILNSNLSRLVTGDTSMPLIAKSGGSKVLPIFIDFGTPLNISGNDVLDVEITSAANTVVTSDAANSYIMFDTVKGYGVQSVIPKISVDLVPQGVSQYDAGLGNGVKRIAYISTDSENLVAASITSDVYDDNLSIDEMKAQQLLRYPEASAMTTFGENKCIYAGSPINNASMHLSLGTVAASKNWVVVRRVITTSQLVKAAKSFATRHAQNTINQIIE